MQDDRLTVIRNRQEAAWGNILPCKPLVSTIM
jgi:hypothetical protein